MGDRYYFTKRCQKCNSEIECYYAPSCCFVTTQCDKCGTKYKIYQDFSLVEILDDEDEKKFIKCFGCYDDDDDDV